MDYKEQFETLKKNILNDIQSFMTEFEIKSHKVDNYLVLDGKIKIYIKEIFDNLDITYTVTEKTGRPHTSKILDRLDLITLGTLADAIRSIPIKEKRLFVFYIERKFTIWDRTTFVVPAMTIEIAQEQFMKLHKANELFGSDYEDYSAFDMDSYEELKVEDNKYEPTEVIGIVGGGEIHTNTTNYYKGSHTTKIQINHIQYVARYYRNAHKLSDTQVEYVLWRYDRKCQEDPTGSWAAIIEQLIDEMGDDSDEDIRLRLYVVE
jgi:hypothetical protein